MTASPAPLAYSSNTPSTTTAAAPATPTIAPAPLAFSSTPTTIAVTSSSSATSQAQRPPRAERLAVHNYLAKQKKQSTLDKWWGDVKKSLGIK